MINVLIITKPDDPHAIMVKLALEKKGHACTLMYPTDLPEFQKHSFTLINNKLIWKAGGVNFSAHDINQFDVVWYRRPRRPVLPEIVHPDDVENATNENIEFFKTLWHVISPNAFWVNPYQSRSGVNCKLKQLQVAAEVGFMVPETLISNDPNEINEFINNKNFDKVIYKTLYPHMWIGENDVRLIYTKEISIDQLPSDEVLQVMPGIFQRKIDKAYELRVTFMGDTAVTAKLRSQEHPQGMQDWRSVPVHELAIDPYTLPDTIHQQCKQLMQKFGVVFGCFDFIVTPDGEYYFLEINEQGQFLWVESINPNIKMLDAFSEFLISKSPRFAWEPSASIVSLDEFNAEMMRFKEIAIATHKEPVEKY